MKDFAELLRGVAALLWPIAAIIALLLFRHQLVSLIGRIRRARLPGGVEIDIERRLDKLQVSTQALEEKVPVIPAEPEAAAQTTIDEAVGEILQTAAVNPRAGLMLVSAELEAAMRRLLAAVGHYPGHSLGIQRMGSELTRVAGIPAAYVKAFEEFAEVRNAIVHGQPDISDDDALRAVDLGLSLLRLTRAWPHEVRSVLAAGREVYSDAEGVHPRNDVTAVLLDVQGVDAPSSVVHAHPTTLSHFRPGQRVSFEWNMARTWGESWYRDVDGSIRYGWRSSAEFVGRPLDEL
jgi:hypothetical protein